jgi:hypothetical protein
MTYQTMTCEQFENRLADYLEGDVSPAERIALDAHVDSCERCGALVHDLRAISATAAALPPIEPPAHVWEGVRSRIGADVVSIDTRRRRWMPMLRGLAAAVVLVVASSSVTYMMTRPDGATGAATTASTGAPIDEPGVEQAPDDVELVDADTVTDADAGSDRRLASVGAGDGIFPNTPAAPEDRAPLRVGSTTYEDEISKLRTVLRSRNADLDRKTVKTIERSLAVIDTAIAQARSALATDPGSRFLNKELTDALDKKVRLLRTAAMLPSKT